MQMLTSAFGTKFGDSCAVSAVVTLKPLANRNAMGEGRGRDHTFVMSERHSTIHTLHLLPTGATEHHSGVSPAVKQQHYLLFRSEPFCDLLDQPAREDPFFAGLLKLFAHIDDLD